MSEPVETMTSAAGRCGPVLIQDCDGTGCLGEAVHATNEDAGAKAALGPTQSTR